MESVKNFKDFKITENNISVDDLLNNLNELGKYNLDEYFVNELDYFCEQYSFLILEEDEEPKVGDLAKATAAQIGKAAVFGWIIGKVIKNVVDPTAQKIGSYASRGGKYIGGKIGKGALAAGKYVDSKTHISKKLSSLNKTFNLGKSGVKGLITRAKKSPVKTAGVAIGIILAAAAAQKLYKVVKQREELEAKKEELLKSENEELKKQIASISNNIETLKTQEVKIKVEYEKELPVEIKKARNKAKEDTEYAEMLAQQAGTAYSSLGSM